MSKNIISLDIGATKFRIGIISKDYKIIKKQIFATPKKATEVLELINQSIKDFYSPEIKSIGIGLAGQINFAKGVVNFGPNFPRGLDNIPLKKNLKQKFHLPVMIDNDAHCFTLAEACLGQGKKFNFVLGVTLGTGIGGGIAINQKIIRGKNNICGEIGHQIIEMRGQKCGCQKQGCWEAYASGSAMMRLYQKTTGINKNTFEIEKDFLRQEEKAGQVVRKTAYYLSVGLSNLINILDPEVIVLGGGLSNFKKFIDLAKEQIKDLVLIPALQKTPILTTKLGDDAGLLGAALLK